MSAKGSPSARATTRTAGFCLAGGLTGTGGGIGARLSRAVVHQEEKAASELQPIVGPATSRTHCRGNAVLTFHWRIRRVRQQLNGETCVRKLSRDVKWDESASRAHCLVGHEEH